MATSTAAAPLVVCGIAGSLRRKSFNRALLRAAQELAPESMEIRIWDRVGEIPLYNQDVEDAGVPESVESLRQAIREAGALLVATPEYNYGVPGVLKNAIDWASRPTRDSVLSGKPTAILGASPGQFGSARAQASLRQSLVFTNTPVMTQPEIYVFKAAGKFDEDLRLTDEKTREFLGRQLIALAEWATRFRT